MPHSRTNDRTKSAPILAAFDIWSWVRGLLGL
jgi:hypothetical protein